MIYYFICAYCREYFNKAPDSCPHCGHKVFKKIKRKGR